MSEEKTTVLNIRAFPPDLLQSLKLGALESKKSLREYVIERLQHLESLRKATAK